MRKLKRQSRLDNQETLATLGIHDRERRQTNQNKTNKNKNNNNPPKKTTKNTTQHRKLKR